MSDTYPWGTQAPQARLSKLQSSLSNSERARSKFIEEHKAKILQFDETDRQIKADIRQCQQVIERERTEANAAQVSRLMMKVVASMSPELVEEALKDGTLEQRLASLASDLDKAPAKASGRKAAKPEKGSSEPAAQTDTGE